MNTLRQTVNTRVKLGYITHGNKCTQYFEVKSYGEQSEAKIFGNLQKINILFMLIITVQIFSLC